MKKFLTAVICMIFALTATLCLSSATVKALSEEGYTCIIRNGKATVTAADEKLCGEIVLPDFMDGYPVVGIAENAFYNCQDITKITLPKSFERLDDNAFYGCSSLAEVVAEGELQAVSTSAFNGTPFYENGLQEKDGVYYFQNFIIKASSNEEDFVIKNGVKTVPSNVFAKKLNVKSVVIPDSVTTIEKKAFWLCEKLATIKIGNKVTRIGADAFENTAYYRNDDNWEDGILYLDCYLLDAKSELSGEVKIKGGTRVIADHAFGGYYEQTVEMSSVILPNGLAVIGERAFSGCDGLIEITLPASLITVHENAFGYCDSLSTVTVKGKKTTFGAEAFEGCQSLVLIRAPKDSQAEQIAIQSNVIYEKTYPLKFLADFATNPTVCLIYAIAITVYAVTLTVVLVVSRLKARGKNKKIG